MKWLFSLFLDVDLSHINESKPPSDIKDILDY